MNNPTQEQIEEAIKNCYWRKVLDVTVCGAELLPCVVVIEKGKCQALKELFKSEGAKEHEEDSSCI